MPGLNYRHLHYFWVVAQEGGFVRAAERLDIAVQTISAQVRELERALGHQLLKPAGRGVALTEAGQAAFARADEIFQLGQRLPDEVRQAATTQVTRLRVGFSDGISKLAAHAVLAPALQIPDVRLVCHEGEFDELQAELGFNAEVADRLELGTAHVAIRHQGQRHDARGGFRTVATIGLHSGSP